jgi:hypothetical protein
METLEKINKKKAMASSLPQHADDLQARAPATPSGTRPLGVKLAVIPTTRSKIFRLRKRNPRLDS